METQEKNCNTCKFDINNNKLSKDCYNISESKYCSYYSNWQHIDENLVAYLNPAFKKSSVITSTDKFKLSLTI